MTIFFERFIRPFLVGTPKVRVLEIGASEGNHSDLLLGIDGIKLVIIDPCLDRPLDDIYGERNNVTVIKEVSLVGIDRLEGNFDCIIIDGDHNWYTVRNELEKVHQLGLLKESGVMFFHDVDWPYGRRDMYYQPELIPDEFRQPCIQQGLVLGQSALTDSSDMNSHLWNAVSEGGERNGVLTAIEDFMTDNQGYRFVRWEEQHGLGIMAKQNADSDSAFKKLERKVRSERTKAYWRKRSPRLYALMSKLLGRSKATE